MNNKLKYSFIVGAVVGIALAVCLWPKSSDTAKHEEELGPDGVVKLFTDAMKAGDFDKALSLCDTVLMKDHLHSYMELWQDKSQKDSATFAVIQEMLAGTQITLTNTETHDGMCTVEYSLEMEKNKKNCTATLKKEGGEWKIAEIIERP